MIFPWKVLKNTLILDDILKLPNSQSFQSLKKILDKEGYFFASYASHFDQNQKSDFWYIINDRLLALQDYPPKVRNEIRQSLKRCQIEIVDPLENWDVLYNLYQVAIDNYKNYSYKNSLSQFKEIIISELDSTDIWLVRDNNNIPVAYGHLIRKSNYVDLFDIKVDPSKTKNLPVFGLLFLLNHFYLSNLNYQFISDGRKSMFHETSFQVFLEKKFLYRKTYCHLHIIYSSNISLLMYFVRILKPVFKKLPAIGPIRKLHLLINYDAIAHSVQ